MHECRRWLRPACNRCKTARGGALRQRAHARPSSRRSAVLGRARRTRRAPGAQRQAVPRRSWAPGHRLAAGGWCRCRAGAPGPASVLPAPDTPQPPAHGTPRHAHAAARQQSRSVPLWLPLWLPQWTPCCRCFPCSQANQTSLTLARRPPAHAYHCAGADVRQVNFWIEDAEGAVNVVRIHDELPKLYLEGLDLAGDLRLLADQAGDQVVIFHRPILGSGQSDIYLPVVEAAT